MLLAKNSEGGAGQFYWKEAGDVVEVPDELGWELLRSNHLGFSIVDQADLSEKPAAPVKKKTALAKEENHVGDLREAINVATGK